MKHICAQPIMKFYHRKYMLQKNHRGAMRETDDAIVISGKYI